jgi:hypothetical protein
MSIRLQRIKDERGERFCPRFYCDWCDNLIEYCGLGVALWDASSSEKVVAVHHAHKGSCHDKLSEVNGMNAWEELRTHADMLNDNTHLGRDSSVPLTDEAAP